MLQLYAPTGTKSSDDDSVRQSIKCQVIYIFLLLLSSQKIGHKRIMLFTNNDNPHAGDSALQVRFLKRILPLELFIPMTFVNLLCNERCNSPFKVVE